MKEEKEDKLTYFLEIDESGTPKMENDQILTVHNNSLLHIEIMNGFAITKEIQCITNVKNNFPFGLIDKAFQSNEKLERETFKDFLFDPNEISTSIVFEFELSKSGPIQILFIYKDEQNNEKLTKPFYIIVQPQIIINGKELPVRSISLQTILSKSLGKIEDFDKFFEEASKLKYNFIHFTPIQKLGLSESLYCLRDNTQLNDIFFNGEVSNEEKLTKFKEAIDRGRDKYNLGSIVDIVLNHAADNSEWLGEHPECGYNLVNTPWLNCAYALDKVLVEFSDNFCDCKTRFNFQPYVNNEDQLNQIIGELYAIVGRQNLHEYFMIDGNKNRGELEKAYDEFNSNRDKFNSKINELHWINNDSNAFEYFFNHGLDKLGEERNGVQIKPIEFVAMIFKLHHGHLPNKNDYFGKMNQFIGSSNDRWRHNVKGMIDLGLNNVRGGIRYEFIQCKHKAQKRIKPLISNYFAVFDHNDKNKIFACNGWIMESEDPNEPAPDFTKKNTYYYFKRKVMIWSDCPKLNYGKGPDDCPYLMQHMTKYVQDMAKIFNGFRLDNAHSTPIYVGEYLAMKAREVNPNLLIIAELFTKKENEIKFVNKIGINLLIRESMYCKNAGDIAGNIHRFGGGFDKMLGKIDEDTFKYVKTQDNVKLKKMYYLQPSLPHSIIFDLTHDNETYLKLFNNLALNLTMMACDSFAHTAIGSTRGYDQLFPIQPSVVNEKRQYAYDPNFYELIKDDEEPEEKEKTVEIKEEEPKQRKIKFEFHVQANSVDLALSSRGWKPDIHLKKESNDYFTVEVELENNTRHFYKYVLNNSNWVFDVNKPNINDGKGNINNYVDVGKSSSSIVSVNKEGKSFHVKDLKIFRRALNKVRQDLSKYQNEFYLHCEGNFINIFRTFTVNKHYLENEPNYDGYALICRTGYDYGPTPPTRIELPGIYTEFVCGCSIKIGYVNIDNFKNRGDLYGTDSEVYFTLKGSYLNDLCKISNIGGKTVLEFNGNIQANTAIILKFKNNDEIRNGLKTIEKGIMEMEHNWKELTDGLEMSDINLILYKCEKEELDNTKGKRGCYGFDNFGSLAYAGISHLHKMLDQFKLTKEDHVILKNIRAGDWLMKYTIDRYSDQPRIKKIYDLLNKMINCYTKLLVHHKPLYATKIIDAIYNLIMLKIMDRTKNNEYMNFSRFSQRLITTIYEFIGYVESARFKFNTELPYNDITLSAGLPHFTTEYLRTWGRDTFISLKGLLLIPGYYEEAKAIILQYAAVMRHGLIPNLFDSGVNSRFNARDATWFFFKSILDYVEMSKDNDIFNTEVNMVFLSDDYNEHNSKKSRGETKKMLLCDILQTILERHANGISFREWRAGPQIDSQMTDEGFNIKIYLNKENGFIYGGNKFNCGTWMDKMGSSEKAKNKGHPGSPRNGADCEIISLLYYCLTHLIKLNNEGIFKYKSVNLNGSEFTYETWANLIKDNFEKYFYCPQKNEFAKYDGTYKDYISDDNDFRHEAQLRCNILIALAITPELFDKEHALKFMKIVDEHLYVKGCIGIRTLDNTDIRYNGNYFVDDDSNDYHRAHGLNYHNGPEWVWPTGYYLLSKMIFNDKDKKEIFNEICYKLIPLEKHTYNSKWNGLPELTNANGRECPASCVTQAWSMGCLIEAVDKLREFV